MLAERLYYRLIFITIVLCHILAGSQFWLKRSELEVPGKWIGQFYFLLCVSLFLSLLFFVYREIKASRLIYLGVKIIIFLVIGYAEGQYLGVEFTLLTLLVIEISAYFELTTGILFTVGIIAITLVNQQAVSAWNVMLSGVALYELFSLSVYTGIIAVFANVLHIVVKRLDNQILETERLDKAVGQLMEANIDFQQYAVAAGEQSAVQERKRISRDIHDTAVHTFITVIMLAESAVDLIEPGKEKILSILQQLITLAKEGVRDTRQALRELRAIDEASPTGLKAVYHLIQVFQEATGVQVYVNFGNLPWEFTEDIDKVLYRMSQEGLTNAFRHGNATRIEVHMWIFEKESESELIIRIHDNGQGSSGIKKGIGLQGMEERLKKVHGRLEAKNVADGFEVTAWIPLSSQK